MLISSNAQKKQDILLANRLRKEEISLKLPQSWKTSLNISLLCRKRLFCRQLCRQFKILNWSHQWTRSRNCFQAIWNLNLKLLQEWIKLTNLKWNKNSISTRLTWRFHEMKLTSFQLLRVKSMKLLSIKLIKILILNGRTSLKST